MNVPVDMLSSTLTAIKTVEYANGRPEKRCASPVDTLVLRLVSVGLLRGRHLLAKNLGTDL
jgi:hypothetical protein